MEFVFSSSQFNYIVICPRVTGSLSVAGSVLTLITLFRTRPGAQRAITATQTKSQGRVYRRLVAALSFYDILYSSMWAANRAMVTKGYGLLYTRGTEASCTAQGVLLQWGTGTFAYSMWISLYYVAVVRYRVREDVLAKWFEPVAHGLILLWSLGWAVAVWAMDMIGPNAGPVCSFTTKPFPCGMVGTPPCTSAELYEKLKWIILIGPAVFYAVVIFASLVTVVVTVSYQRRKVKRTLLGQYPRASGEDRHASSSAASSSTSLPPPPSSLGMAASNSTPASSSSNMAMSTTNDNNNRTVLQMDKQLKQVTVQCILYGVTFFNSLFWQCLFLVLLEIERFQSNLSQLFWLLAISLIFSPLQGLFNHFIHTRPRFLQVRADYPDKSFWWHYRQAVWNASCVPTRPQGGSPQPSPPLAASVQVEKDGQGHDEKVVQDPECFMNGAASPPASEHE